MALARAVATYLLPVMLGLSSLRAAQAVTYYMAGPTSACNAVPTNDLDVTVVAATSSTAYPNNVNCGVAVSANPAPGNLTALQFTSVDLQASVDMVWVHDGFDATAPVIAVFSAANSYYVGTGLSTSLYPFSVLSSGAWLFVRFSSDASTALKGFTASVVASTSWDSVGMQNDAGTGCGPSRVFGGLGYRYVVARNAVTYVNISRCVLTIMAPHASMRLRLAFTSFYTQANQDTLKVYDGSTNSSSFISSMSGTQAPSLCLRRVKP